MKLTFHANEMMNAISPMMCAVSNKNTVQAIECVLLDVTDSGICFLTTFDLEKGMRRSLTVQSDVPGKALLPANKFLNTLRVLGNDTVEMTVDEAKYVVDIVSGKSKFRMMGLNPREFPQIPSFELTDGFVLLQSDLKEMLSKISVYMGVNDQRAFLNGCYLHVDGKGAVCVGCDSFRLGKMTKNVTPTKAYDDGSALDYTLLIPNKAVSEILKLLEDDAESTVKVTFNRKNTVLFLPDTIFFTRLLDGNYVDFNRILAKPNGISVVGNRERILLALERASLVTEEKVAGAVRSHVKITLGDNLLSVSAMSGMGSADDEVEVKKKGGDLVIAFNNRYLMEALRNIDTEEIEMEFSDRAGGMYLVPVQNNNTEEYMILPVRMKDQA